MDVVWILIKSNFGCFGKDGGISIIETKEATCVGLGVGNDS